jgi:ATP-binding cassette subfamily C protein
LGRAQPSGSAALLSDYRRFAGHRLWLALALMILGAVAEGFGLLMIVPLASIAIGGDNATGYMRWIGGWSADLKFMSALALFVGAMAARSLLLFGRDVLLARLGFEYEANLRLRLAATLAARGWTFASRIGQAGMQSLLLTDVPRSAVAVRHLQNLAVGAIMLLVQLTLTFILSPALTLVAIAFLAIAFLLSLRFARRGVSSGFAMRDAMEDSTEGGFRLHAGLKAALAQGTAPAFMAEYAASLQWAVGKFTEFARDFSLSRQLAAFGAALAAAALLLVGVKLLALPFPVLIASLVLFARMSGPAQQLQSSALQAAAYAPAFAAIEHRLGALEWRPPPRAPVAPLDWERLEFNQVGFDHQPGLGIEQASFALSRAEWLGLEGPSGAGKTTLIDLAAGLLLPQRGEVTVDGQRLVGPVLERWRAAIAYVGQDGTVFNDSVRGNLLAEGSDADEERLWQVLEAVGLAWRVRAFPAGLDENVGDRGSQLSGGERQRLVLARALLRSPSLLILDEATAALDADGEAELIQSLKALDSRPAALVVAHRDSTLHHCDSLLSIQHGVVRAAAASPRA